ncbi:MAG: protein translocase subunit SecF, partial [Leptotrichia sp.]|nr:protein translocase subunit SecF [Leptotrichia sp.]
MVNLKVIRYKNFYIGFSALMVTLSLIFFLTIGLNLGIDFKGGDLLQVKYEKPVNKDVINKSLDELTKDIPELGAKKVQISSDDNTMILRTGQLSEVQKNNLLGKLTEKTGKYEIIRYDTVGATIGKELTRNAVWALVIGSILIVIYVTIRFEFVYAIAGIIALLHDVLICIGLIALLRYEVDTPFIAAILTILGYSINDTIVIFDRIRENDKRNEKEKHNKKTFEEIIEMSVNQVCMRSLYTSITTLFSVVILLIFGGESLRTFNMTLFIGMIFGRGFLSLIFVIGLLSWMEIARLIRSEVLS